MPHLGTDPELPLNGTTPLSRHCSYEGARAALPRAGSQAWTIYLLLRREAMTRHELSDRTGLPVTSICARLAWLKKQGLIQECGSVKGPYQVANVRYQAI